jgi:hypothetical protein
MIELLSSAQIRQNFDEFQLLPFMLGRTLDRRALLLLDSPKRGSMTARPATWKRVICFGLVTVAIISADSTLMTIAPFRQHSRLAILGGAIVLLILNNFYFHVFPWLGTPPWKQKKNHQNTD